MLPSDFTGSPAGAVRGNVLVGDGQDDATRPRLSLEWVAGAGGAEPGAPALVGQAVSFQRSIRIENDWDIGLDLPPDEAKFALWINRRPARIGVAKIVYFDDVVPDGRLDWSCQGAPCDRVKAVSAEFVLFVETPPACQRDGQPWLRGGYHFFALDGEGGLHPFEPAQALSFTLGDFPPAPSEVTAELRAFTAALRSAWSGNGC